MARAGEPRQIYPTCRSCPIPPTTRVVARQITGLPAPELPICYEREARTLNEFFLRKLQIFKRWLISFKHSTAQSKHIRGQHWASGHQVAALMEQAGGDRHKGARAQVCRDPATLPLHPLTSRGTTGMGVSTQACLSAVTSSPIRQHPRPGAGTCPPRTTSTLGFSRSRSLLNRTDFRAGAKACACAQLQSVLIQFHKLQAIILFHKNNHYANETSS